MSIAKLREIIGAATKGPWSVEDPMDFELTIVEAGKETYEWRSIASCSLPEGDDDQDFTAREVHANAQAITASHRIATWLVSEGAVEELARFIYEREPFYEPGECVEGFTVTPGGNLSWEQALARDAEFEGFMLPVTKDARDAAITLLDLIASKGDEP